MDALTIETHFAPAAAPHEVAGLSASEAEERLRRYGRNEFEAHVQRSWILILVRQVKSPLILLLVFAATVSAFVGEWVDAAIVLVVIIASSLLGFAREYHADRALQKLQGRLQSVVKVLRDGTPVSIPVAEVVPGDVVLLSAGRLVPGDGVVLEATDFYVSESALTGESFPVLKTATEMIKFDAADPRSRVFLGTNVRSGSARCLIAATGRDTKFGHIARRLGAPAPETSFERGLRNFSNLLSISMLLLTFIVFAVNMLYGRSIVSTLLFSIALAVGLSPELLPAILNINLARSTHLLAEQGVLVRRLNAIENLGSLNILCTDKTGTLTEGVVQVEGSYDTAGRSSKAALDLAAINAALETGLDNPLDDAILAATKPTISNIHKIAEVPFDSIRKRVTVLIQNSGECLLITKGALKAILSISRFDSTGNELDQERKAAINDIAAGFAGRGMRLIAVATKTLCDPPSNLVTAESEMKLIGLVTFFDQPKHGVAETLERLKELGVAIKIITGDSSAAAGHVARLVGAPAENILTGPELYRLNAEAFSYQAARTDIFAEVDANQKERIILALKKSGQVVGFLGDGVNDAPAMRAADTSISVDQAVDVARESADFVLLKRDLDVLRQGVEEGRRTFANTLKYISMTTSANVGNMLSMAAASLWLPFLPLSAGQILLNNFLSDIPAIGFADDCVDPELTEKPCVWDTKFIGRFMATFGAFSSLFDALLFALLLLVFRASVPLFQTAWFVESVLSEILVALVIRTHRRPGRLLFWSTIALVPISILAPILPGAALFGFVPIPWPLLLTILAVTTGYVGSVEMLKAWFFRKERRAINQRKIAGVTTA
jgi:Mg2+-importing ATPase